MNRKTLTAFSTLLVGALFAFAAQSQDPQNPAPAQGAARQPDPKIIEGLMECLADGLPEGWKKAWFTVGEIGRTANLIEGTTRQFEAKFFYATDPDDAKGRSFTPCGPNRIVDGVIALNDYLLPSQMRWTGVTMTFLIDGSYSANYDYTERKPAPSKAAAKPAARKKQEAAK